jgi:hypothetical protein
MEFSCVTARAGSTDPRKTIFEWIAGIAPRTAPEALEARAFRRFCDEEIG